MYVSVSSPRIRSLVNTVWVLLLDHSSYIVSSSTLLTEYRIFAEGSQFSTNQRWEICVASDWLKFEALHRKFRTPLLSIPCSFLADLHHLSSFHGSKISCINSNIQMCSLVFQYTLINSVANKIEMITIRLQRVTVKLEADLLVSNSKHGDWTEHVQ